MTETSVLAIIPARYHSTRLPGKALADIGGRPMIEHVYRRASAARTVAGVVVATDDARIVEAVAAFGGVACMTRADHPSGTDRLAELAAELPAGILVNVQGDEPLLDPAAIDAAVAPLLADPAVGMSTLCRPLAADEAARPDVVKVVRALDGTALYFSRAAIPYPRDPAAAACYAHVGLYVYRRTVLLRLAALAPSPLERAESLEQLRALEHRIAITVVETAHAAPGVDTPADLERVRQQFLLQATRE
ncbi:MAG: 3-deoxy-manno-octulosonate cytidylyltransferase [Acidobacteriota bacterium]